MNSTSFQLYLIVKTNFLLVSLVAGFALVVFSLVANKTFPSEALGLFILIIPMLLNQTKHIVKMNRRTLKIISEQFTEEVTWDLEELEILEAKKLATDSTEIPPLLKPTFLSFSTSNPLVFGQLEDGQEVFQFVTRKDVPLVFIPLKSGGQFLLSIKEPDAFLTSLFKTTLESLESA